MRTGAVELIECRARFIQEMSGRGQRQAALHEFATAVSRFYICRYARNESNSES